MVTDTSGILLSSESLGLGETVRTHCPTCNGNRPTLTITRRDDGSVVWNCYRAACDERGARGQSGGVSRAVKAKPRVTHYEGALRMLDDDERNFLAYKIGWNEEHIALARARWAIELSRYAFPIIGPDHQRRGYVMRSWSSPTKALTMMDVATAPHLAWYRRDDGPVVVVEDIPSAVRAAMAGAANAVALCGTSCGYEYALEIARHSSRAIWALDQDATRKAFDFQYKWDPMFRDGSTVLPLEVDIKDMREDALKALLLEVL